MQNSFVPNAKGRIVWKFPFGLTSFILGIPDLQYILEREFRLNYYGRLSIAEIRNMDVRKVEWFFNRLAKERQDENQINDGGLNG